MNIRFGTWNATNLYMAGSFMIVAKDTSNYMFDLVEVQAVRWDNGGTKPGDKYTFFLWKGE
jgi:hypothetical protein